MKPFLIPLALLVILAGMIALPFLLAEAPPEQPEQTPSSMPETDTPKQAAFTAQPEISQNWIAQSTLSQIGIAPEILVVRVHSVNIHTQPELNSPVTGWLYQNDQAQPEICDSGWVKLINSGWVWGGCFQVNPCGEQENCQ